MTRSWGDFAGPCRHVALACAALAALPSAWAVETSASGRLTFGAVYRTEARDPVRLTRVNAAAIGLEGLGNGGNADDANTNYGRGDMASRALHGYLDLSARAGGYSALLRVLAWRDYALLDDPRPWGNVANGYAAGQPLSDAGAPTLSRFSGIAVADAWVQRELALGTHPALLRIGQQTLDWGAGTSMAGGLEAVNAKDLPALHRAGAVPQEARVPAPMLFGRLGVTEALGVEGFWQAHFTPTALDMCGTLWSMSDYLVPGCDKVMTGQPLVSDRARVAIGAYQKRLPTPRPGSSEFGIALTWKGQDGSAGLYLARYTARTPMPGLRKSLRDGPAMIPGDPDGKNLAYFTEYPDRIRLAALTFSRRVGATTLTGELSQRANQPFMLAPGDVVPPFLNPKLPSLLRADVDAVAPGGLFHGFDSYPVTQAQVALRRQWRAGAVALTAGAEAVAKHTRGLPDQAVRRYGRADIFGPGPVFGACPPATGNPALQCSLRGYATANAWAYRLRLDARVPQLLPGLALDASAVFTHDVKGWSGDFLVNQGRRSANLALRFEYRKRYLAELAWMPVWGGDYNPAADRDTAALSVGVRF